MIKINNSKIVSAYYGSTKLSAIGYQNNLFRFEEPIIEYVVSGTEAISLALVEGKADDWREKVINNGDGTSTVKIYASTPPTKVCFKNTTTDASSGYVADYDLRQVTKFDGSRLTDMRYMFCGCRGLKYVNTELFDTSNVKRFDYAFYYCTALADLDVSRFNTKNATHLINTFYQCRVLKTIDVSDWITDKVTSFNGLFLGCQVVENLDVANWRTSTVTNMEYAFGDCYKLKALNLSSWDTSNTTHMGGFFRNCYELTSDNLHLPTVFVNSKCKRTKEMFSGCTKLTYLDDSLYWNTSSLEDASYMFNDCTSLVTLGHYTWDVHNVQNMSCMFRNCSSLLGVGYANEGIGAMFLNFWITPALTNCSSMFEGCTSMHIVSMPNLELKQACNTTDMFKSTGIMYIIGGPTYCSLINILKNLEDRTSLADGNYGGNLGAENFGTPFAIVGGTSTITLGTLDVLTSEELTTLEYYATAMETYNWAYMHAYNENYNYIEVKVPTGGLTFTLQADRRGDDNTLEFVDWGDESTKDSMCYQESEMSHTFTTPGLRVIKTQLLPSLPSNNAVDSTTHVESYLSVNTNITVWDYAFFNHTSMIEFNGNWLEFGISENSTSYKCMFRYNSTLERVTMNGRSDFVTNMSAMFYECPALKSVEFSDFTARSVKDLNNLCGNGDTSLTSFTVGLTPDGRIGESSSTATTALDVSNMFNGCNKLATLVFPIGKANDPTPIGSMRATFYNCKKLTTFPDLSGWDLRTATDMYTTFGYVAADATQLPAVSFGAGTIAHLQNWLSVTDTRQMWYRSNIASIDISAVQAPQVKYTNQMFSKTTAKAVSMAAANFYQVSDMSQMFDECSSLEAVDFNYCSLFTCLAPTPCTNMFRKCVALKNVNGLQQALTFCQKGISSMEGMFEYCEVLENIAFSIPPANLTSGYVRSFTEPCTSMKRMFYKCYKLKNVDVRTFNTKNVIDMDQMFGYNYALEVCDISSFEVPKLQTAKSMFAYCPATVFMDRFRTTDALASDGFSGIFTGCEDIFVYGYCLDDKSTNRLLKGIVSSSSLGVNILYVPGTSVNTSDQEAIDNIDIIAGTSVWNIHYTTDINVYEVEIGDDAISDASRLFELVDASRGRQSGNWNQNFLGEDGITYNGNWYSIFTNLNINELYSTTQLLPFVGRRYTIVTPHCTNATNAPTATAAEKVRGLYGICNSYKDLSYFCQGLSNLETVQISEDFESTLNATTKYFTMATTMLDMFANCISLRNVQIYMRLSSLFDMTGTFYNCDKLVNFDSGVGSPLQSTLWYTNSLEWIQGTFRECHSLKRLDLSNWYTSQVQGFADMFNNAYSMELLTLSGWYFNKIIYGGNFHWACPNMNVYMNNVTYNNIKDFLNAVNSITPCDGGALYYDQLDGFNATTELEVAQIGCPKGWAPAGGRSNVFAIDVPAGTTITLYNDRRGDSSTLTANVWGDGSSDSSMSHKYNTAGRYVISSKYAVMKPAARSETLDSTSAKYIFRHHMYNTNMNNLSHLFAGANCTSYCMEFLPSPKKSGTKCTGLFKNNYQLKSINLDGWITSNVTDVHELMHECRNMTEFNCDNWDLVNCDTFYGLCYQCENLTHFQPKGWVNTHNNVSFRYTFSHCKKMSIIDLSMCRTEKVYDMAFAFRNTSVLQSLNLSNWAMVTSSSIDTERMFTDSGIRRSQIITNNTTNIERILSNVAS